MRASIVTLCVVLGSVACGSERAHDDPSAGGATGDVTGAGSESTHTGDATGSASDPGTSSGSDDHGLPNFDVPSGDASGGGVECRVGEDGDAPGPCVDEAPPDSFDPVLQWAWTGPPGHAWSVVTPLVANLTDDNGDGVIDMCDTPDVLVSAYENAFGTDQLFLLDGATGELHYAFEGGQAGTPAIGDIDGDGEADVVGYSGGLVAWNADGSFKWHSDVISVPGEVGLADLDNDGDVEIYTATAIVSHTGEAIWQLTDVNVPRSYGPVAVDLDGDDDLEVVYGTRAYHHDGTPYYLADALSSDYVQVAVGNLDDDDEPEILVTALEGVSLLEHDGSVKWSGRNPNGDPITDDVWRRPAAIHDFDGDGVAEFAMNSATHFSVFEADASVVWMADVAESSGTAAGTGFDFIGSGTAQAVFADEFSAWVFGEGGTPLMQVPRTSWTAVEYPVVADVDNDGSAELVVVSNIWPGYHEGPSSPTVQVFRDQHDRWIPARRIWNQQSYHVTNVTEDGRIPQFESPHWKGLNTFRTQAQIDPAGGGVCRPAG